jgi:hypothetical protein
MSWNTVKRDPADAAFSEYVRRKDGQCKRCGRRGTGLKGITGLDASHFHSRRKESVRFDLENVDAMCRSCHKWLGEHMTEYKQWKLAQLGQDKYDLLMLRANARGDKNREAEKIFWRQALRNDYGEN